MRRMRRRIVRYFLCDFFPEKTKKRGCCNKKSKTEIGLLQGFHGMGDGTATAAPVPRAVDLPLMIDKQGLIL